MFRFRKSIYFLIIYMATAIKMKVKSVYGGWLELLIRLLVSLHVDYCLSKKILIKQYDKIFFNKIYITWNTLYELWDMSIVSTFQIIIFTFMLLLNLYVEIGKCIVDSIHGLHQSISQRTNMYKHWTYHIFIV